MISENPYRLYINDKLLRPRREFGRLAVFGFHAFENKLWDCSKNITGWRSLWRRRAATGVRFTKSGALWRSFVSHQVLCKPPQDPAWLVVGKDNKALRDSHILLRERLTAFILRIAYIKDKLVVVSEKHRRLYNNDKLY